MDLRFAFEVGSSLCVQTSIVIAAALVLQRWVTAAEFGCRLWTAVFVSLIALVTAALIFPHRRLFDFPAEVPSQSLLSMVVWQGRITTVMAIVWGTGIAVSLIKRTLHCIGLARFLKSSCTAVNVHKVLKGGGITSRTPANLVILTSERLHGPFCWQLHRPVIVLPAYLLDDDEMTLRHVLLHELEHLQTQHPMQHFLQGACSTLFWFHPLVWSAARSAEINREYLCDEAAARTSGKFSDYLRTLAKVAERSGSESCIRVAKGTLAFGNQKNALVLRSDRLVKLAEGKSPQSRWRQVLAIATLLLCAGLVQQIWLPTNAMASQRSDWSPWPSWTANALHQINVSVRDFELFEDRVQMHELLSEDD